MDALPGLPGLTLRRRSFVYGLDLLWGKADVKLELPEKRILIGMAMEVIDVEGQGHVTYSLTGNDGFPIIFGNRVLSASKPFLINDLRALSGCTLSFTVHPVSVCIALRVEYDTYENSPGYPTVDVREYNP